MYRNWRVGKIKFVPALREGKHNWVLIDVLEWCASPKGVPYQKMPRYNIWVYFDATKFDITPQNVGDWVEVGFYIQAFRNTELSEDYTNVLTMKQLHYIKEMDAMKCAERIFQSINNN